MKRFKVSFKRTLFGLICILAGYSIVDLSNHYHGYPDLKISSEDAVVRVAPHKLDRSIEYYKSEIRENPSRIENYVFLSQLYLQASRITGMESYFIPLAQTTLQSALANDPDHPMALAAKAATAMSMHRFEEALNIAEMAIRLNPYNIQAYGVLVDAHVELGSYSAAVDLCDKMLRMRPDLRSYARASYLRQIYGRYSEAIAAMELASSSAHPSNEDRAWTQVQLGKLHFDHGDLKTAEHLFYSVLRDLPGYADAMAGQAGVLSLRGENQEAISLLLNAYETKPDPGFLIQLVDAYRKAGMHSEAENTIKRVISSFERYEDLGWIVDQEYAVFCADNDVNLNEALIRSAREFRRRPRNYEVLEVYAWVLFKNGRTEKAKTYIEKAMSMGTRDAELYFRAGMIMSELGLKLKAEEYLQMAGEINPARYGA